MIAQRSTDCAGQRLRFAMDGMTGDWVRSQLSACAGPGSARLVLATAAVLRGLIGTTGRPGGRWTAAKEKLRRLTPPLLQAVMESRALVEIS